MNDEGVGIAGWLLADLVLVLAIVFLALTPGRDASATRLAVPVILEIGCAIGTPTDEQTIVRCSPQIEGGMPSFYGWAVEQGTPTGSSDEPTFEASFAGAGAIRLTVSNEGGEHSAAFPVLPPTASGSVAPPVILDIGCVIETSDGWGDVRCTPWIGGGEPSTYGWTAERGRARSPESGTLFSASFAGAGAIRLTVSNQGGQHGAAFPVLSPQPAVVLELSECSDVQTDFRFAQIVLTGAALGGVTWDDIASGRVRENLIKAQELEKIRSGDWSELPAEAFLREKLGEQLRIAMVETFSNAPTGSSTKLSGEVNDAFRAGLDEAGIEKILRGRPTENRWAWFGDYLATAALEPGEVRLNLYFVKPFDDEDCQ